MEKKVDNSEKRIIDLVASESRFTKLNQAINAAGLVDRFSSQNNFTLFAPTNEAFAKLSGDFNALLQPENREHLRKLLLLHVVPGALAVNDLKKADGFKTESGQPIKISVSQDLKEIQLTGAKVMLPMEAAKNGFIYPLDAVLQPTKSATA
jgi:uncharacterized surface protein with fasciclin (FAS1) repeats